MLNDPLNEIVGGGVPPARRPKPSEKLISIAERIGLSPDLATDFAKVINLESGNSHYDRHGRVKVSPPDPRTGERAVGATQIKPSTAKPYKLDVNDEDQNLEAGLRYFSEGGPDPVARRLHYFGGPRAKQSYERTGRIPKGQDVTGTTFGKYVQATGGSAKLFTPQPQDPLSEVVSKSTADPLSEIVGAKQPIDSALSVAVQDLQQKGTESKRQKSLQAKVQQARSAFQAAGPFQKARPQEQETIRRAIQAIPFRPAGPFSKGTDVERVAIQRAVTPKPRSLADKVAPFLPAGALLNLIPEEERQNYVEGVTGALANTAAQLANAQEFGMKYTPLGAVGRIAIDKLTGRDPMQIPATVRRGGRALQQVVAENEAQRSAPAGIVGEVRRGVGRGVGAMAVELPKLIGAGQVLGAANLPVQGALAGADEGYTGIIRGAAGGLVYHYGGQLTGKVLGKVGNSLVWIGGPVAEAQAEAKIRGTEAPSIATTLGENLPFGAFAGVTGSSRKARRLAKQQAAEAAASAEPVQVKEGETVRSATEEDLPRIVTKEIEVVPPAVEAARQRVKEREHAKTQPPPPVEPVAEMPTPKPSLVVTPEKVLTPQPLETATAQSAEVLPDRGARTAVQAPSTPEVVTAYRYGPEGGEVTFSSRNRDYAEEYAIVKGGKPEDVREVQIKFKDPLVVEMQPREFSDPAAEQRYIRQAKQEGRDGVIFKQGEDEFYVTISKPKKPALPDKEVIQPSKFEAKEVIPSESTEVSGETKNLQSNLVSKGEGVESNRVSTPEPSKAGKKSKDLSLSQFVRSMGGIAPDYDLRGEFKRLHIKDTGTTGLINKNARQGNVKQSADIMREAANEAGYGPFENPGDFLYALERDVGAIKDPSMKRDRQWSTSRDVNAEVDRQISEYYAKQEADYRAKEARENLLTNGRGAELFDKIAEGKSNESEQSEFVELGRKAGLSDWEARTIRDEALQDAATAMEGVSPTPVQGAGKARERDYFRGDEIEYTGKVTPDGFREFTFLEGPRKGQTGQTLTPEAKQADVEMRREERRQQQEEFGRLHKAKKAEQFGFVEEGLRQQEAPPPKRVDQRERLLQEEKARQEAANPEKTAALKTLAELKQKGMTVDEYARQGSLIGELPSAKEITLLRELESPSIVRAARERKAKRASDKAAGIEQRHAGPDPTELIDNIIIHGWDLYSQKVRPTFQEWSSKIRERFGPESEAHLQKVWADLGGEKLSSTAAKREKVTEDRAARGEEPIAKPERKPDEKLLADAKEANAKDAAEPIRIADQVLNGKKPALSDKETVQLDLHVQDLKNKYDALNKEISAATSPEAIKELGEKSDAMEREMRIVEEAWASAGTEQARAFRSRRIEIDQDFSLLAMVARAKKARGRDLTPEERTTIKEQQAKLAELEIKLAESNKRAEQAEAERAIGKIKNEVLKETRRAGRQMKRASLDDEAAQLKQLIAQAWKKQSTGSGEIHSAMGLAKLDPEGVVTKLVVQLARNRVEAHIGLKAEALVDEVHGLLKDAVDLSRRDVAEMISGYGKTFEMSQEQVDVRLRELKSIIAANLGKADIIEKGIRPLRRGMQRDKPTQEVRAAMRELRDTLREHGMQVERSKGSPEEQQQSSLDAAKTRTRNRIEDLNKWIADGKRTVANKVEIIPDAELKSLQGERDRLQKIFEAIDDPVADQKKIENALKAVAKSINDLQVKISSGAIGPKPKIPSLSSPELDAARAEQKALRGILTDLRNAAKPQVSDAEVEARKILSANNALRSRMEKQAAELERRMKQGDFSEPKKRAPIPYSRENVQLQKQLEQIKHEYAKANYRATRGRGGMITDELAKSANVPKTLKSMGDISAVFRQGGFYSLTHPVEGFAKPTAAMLRAFTETGYRNVEQAIQNHPKFDQAKRDGVEFTGVDKNDPRLSRKEEGYFGGETIDLLASGKYNPIKAVSAVKNFSERTFVSFLDSQRMHMYDTITKGLEAQGLTPRNAPKSYKGAAKLINIGTGRGNLGKWGNQAAPLLNLGIFSPRLLVSRVQLLNNMFIPVAIARKPPGIRAQNIKDNVKFLAATAVIMQLARAAGGTVNTDPDDADFLKIRFGKTTYDTLTGLQQPLRYIINMKRAALGRDEILAVTPGETYPGQSMGELTTRFARSKESPLAGLATDAISGSDFRGRKFEAKRALVETVTPLPYKDFSEAMEKEGLVKGFLKATPALTGVGVQTYDERPDKPSSHAEKLARRFIRESMPDTARDDGQIELDDKKAQLRARARKGEDVKTELKGLDITDRQRKAILGSKGKTRLEEDFNRLGLENAVIVYETMSADERKQNRAIIARKSRELLGNLPKEKQERMRVRLRALGLLPPLSKETIQSYFPKQVSP